MKTKPITGCTISAFAAAIPRSSSPRKGTLMASTEPNLSPITSSRAGPDGRVRKRLHLLQTRPPATPVIIGSMARSIQASETPPLC